MEKSSQGNGCVWQSLKGVVLNCFDRHCGWRFQYFCFTSFAMTLNQLMDGQAAILPPTDARLRPDIRLLEEGNIGVCMSLSLSVCLGLFSLSLCLCLSVSLSVCLGLFPLSLFLCLFLSLCLCLSVSLSLSLSVGMSVCLSVCHLPWYNCTGWLDVEHQLTTTVSLSLSPIHVKYSFWVWVHCLSLCI